MTKIALLLAALAVAGELALRLMGFGTPLVYQASRDALNEGQYELAPDQTSVRFGNRSRINDLGTRGADAEARPAPGIFRVLVIGDSVVNGGAMVDDSETFPVLLEGLLRQSGCKAEVLNASAGGWSVFNEAGWLRTHGNLGSDLVVQVLNGADLSQMPGGNPLGRNPSFPEHRPILAIGEVFDRYLAPRIWGSGEVGDRGVDTAGISESGSRMILNAINGVAVSQKESGADFALLFWDAPTAGTSPSNAEDTLRTLARKADVPLWVLHPMAEPNSQELLRDAIHPSKLGNRWIANNLAAMVKSHCAGG